MLLPVMIAVGGSERDNKAFAAAAAAVGGSGAGHQIAGFSRKLESLETVVIALNALKRRLEIGVASNVADAPMPQAGDMIDQGAHRLPVINPDLIEGRVGCAIDQHARNAGIAEVGDRSALRVGTWRQDDAINAALVKGGDNREFVFGVVLGVREEHHHAENGRIPSRSRK